MAGGLRGVFSGSPGSETLNLAVHFAVFRDSVAEGAPSLTGEDLFLSFLKRIFVAAKHYPPFFRPATPLAYCQHPGSLVVWI